MPHTIFFIFALVNIVTMTAGFFPFIDDFNAPEALATGCAINFLLAAYSVLLTNTNKRRAIIQRRA